MKGEIFKINVIIFKINVQQNVALDKNLIVLRVFKCCVYFGEFVSIISLVLL